MISLNKNKLRAYIAGLLAVVLAAASMPMPAAAENADEWKTFLSENQQITQTGGISREPEIQDADPEFVPGELLVCLRGEDTSLLGSGLKGTGLPAGLTCEKLMELTATPAEGEGDAGLLSAGLLGTMETGDADLNGEDAEGTEEGGARRIVLVKAEGCNTREELEALIKKLEALPEVEYAELNEALRIERSETVEHPQIESIDTNASGQDGSTGLLQSADTGRRNGDLTYRQWAYAENTEEPGFAGNVHMGVNDPDTEPASRKTNWNEYEEDGVTPIRLIQPEKQDMVVAVIDTGIDYTHPDLVNVMWDEGLEYPELVSMGGGKYGYNAAEKNSEGMPYSSQDPADDHKHGTHCAGIIGAQWNGSGVSGVTSDVKLMAVKIANEQGNSKNSEIVKGFAYVAEAMRCGVNVVAANNSWGEYRSEGRVFDDCITELGRLGAVSCFAAGNDGVNNDYIGSLIMLSQHNPYLVTVGAIQADGALADFSCYGKRTVDVAAPGVNVYSTIPLWTAGADSMADKLTPSVAARGKAVDTFETASVNGEGELTGTWFDFSQTLSPEIADGSGYRGGKALKLNLGKQKEINPSAALPTLKIEFDLDEFTQENRPAYFGLAYCSTDYMESTAVRAVRLELRDASGNLLGANAVSAKKSMWDTVSVPIPETAQGKISVTVLAYPRVGSNIAARDITVLFDNVLLTSEKNPYGYMSGTSMATPAVTGEAAALMAVNYDTPYAQMSPQEKQYRAMETAARIKGSVKELPKDGDSDRIGSGGYARLDYALHGNTQPVITDLLITEMEDGKSCGILTGFYLNGMTGTDPEGEAVTYDAGISALLMDGVNLTENIIDSDSSGHWIRFLLPEDLSAEEHIFTVVSENSEYGSKTGIVYLSTESAGTPPYYRRYAIETETAEQFGHTQPQALTALKNRLYYIGAAIGADGLEDDHAYLWSAEIRNAGAADQTVSADWKRIADLGDDFERSVSMTACDGKLYITQAEPDGNVRILRYIPETGQLQEQVLDGLDVTGQQIRLSYSQGHMLLLAYRNIEQGGQTAEVSIAFELDPETLEVQRQQQLQEAVNKYCQIVPAKEEGRFLIIGGQNNFGRKQGTVAELKLEKDAITQKTLAVDLFQDLPGREASSSSCFSMAGVQDGYITVGPVLFGTDGRILKDVFSMNNDLGEIQALDRQLAATAMDSPVMAAYKGKVYVLALELEAENSIVFAGINANTRSPEGDYPLHPADDDAGGSSAGSLLPSYVDKAGRWTKQLSADGRELWTYQKTNGAPAKNEWVAVACTTWRSDVPGAYRWFRFDKDGIMQTGWFNDTDGNRYYLDPTPGTNLGSMVTGWQIIDGMKYYFREKEGGPKGSLNS